MNEGIYWNHNIVMTNLKVAIPDGTYFPEFAQISAEEKKSVLQNNPHLDSDDVDAMEREWAVLAMIIEALKAIGVSVLEADSHSAGSEFFPINKEGKTNE